MKAISIETYIASNNPDEAMALLKEMGSPKPKDFDDLVAKLHIATKKHGAKAFERLSKMETPYKSLVLSYEEEDENKSNCSGGCKCGGSSNFSGDDVSNMELANLFSVPSEIPAPTPVQAVVPQISLVNEPFNKSENNYLRLHPTAVGVGVTLLGIAVVIGVVKMVK